VRQCYFEVATGVQGQGRVGVALEVEPPLVPPLVGRGPLHGDVPIRLALTELDRIAADAYRPRLTPPNHLEEDDGVEVVLP
jgi:hypothetical protein